MVKIATYTRQQGLESDRSGMPRVSLGGQVAAGNALQNVGNQIAGFGNQVQGLAEHMAKRAEEEDSFKAGVADDLRRQKIAGAYDEARRSAAADGSGFHENFLKEADKIATESFGGMSPTQREKYAARWTVERQGWMNRSAGEEVSLKGNYQRGAISDLQKGLINEIGANPDPNAADSIYERGLERIRSASALTSAEKLAMEKQWAGMARTAELQARFANDPDGMRTALGSTKPGQKYEPVETTGGFTGSISYENGAVTINGKRFEKGVSPLSIAREMVGMDEDTHRKTLSEFFEKTGGAKIDPKNVPWCAAFADAVLGASGNPRLGSLRAADFLKYGSATDKPSQGDVVVFKPLAANSSGHVGIVVGIEGNRVRYIGGNDGNAVSEDTLSLDKVAGFRKPPNAGTALPGIVAPAADPRFTEIDAGTREQLIRRAETNARAIKAEVGNLIADDLASTEATGTGLPETKLDRAKVAASLGENAAREWEMARARAAKVHGALDGIETLPESEVENRLKSLEPEAGKEGFTEDMAAYKKARAKADKFLEARRADPALSVNTLPDVRSVVQGLKYDDNNGVKVIQPASAQALVQARLRAQSALGITEPQAVTRSEAAVIARQLRMIGEEAPDKMQSFVNSLYRTYGDYADEVLGSVFMLQNVNRELSSAALNVLSSVAKGAIPDISSIRKLDAHISWKPEDAAGGSALNGMAGESAKPLPQPPGATFDGADLKWLWDNRNDPNALTEFDTKYPGQSARVLKDLQRRFGEKAK